MDDEWFEPTGTVDDRDEAGCTASAMMKQQNDFKWKTLSILPHEKGKKERKE